MRYVIVGAGPAGVVAAETIRKLDADGTITLIGDEPEPPYSRMAIPYYLVGKIGEEGTHLRHDPDHFRNLRIDHVQRRVTRVDPNSNTVVLDDGRHLQYNQLLIATGASPIRPPIPGLDLPGVHTCWTLADARRIAELATPGSHVVLMGAGFVGTIVLEALAMRDVELTVVEMGDRMVPRMMDETAGNMLRNWCEAKGVHVRTGTRITSIHPAGNKEEEDKPGILSRLIDAVTPAGTEDGAKPEDGLRVELSNGETLAAHLVVVSAGVKPNIGFLEGSGLAVDQGILVDDHLRTNHPGIYAAGDVCQGRDIMSREFHVHAIQPTATEHGRVAAYNMTGHEMAFVGSLNMNVLDTLGLISSSFGVWEGKGGQSVRLVDEERWRYLRLEFEEDRLVGAQSVGMTENIGALRGLIQTGVPLGEWKDVLLAQPQRFMEAYVGRIQG
ncbi:NAD(P)/FAD-dependent oxidoreductase [Telmatospirillum sp. J64-1]|uniref:NAD(P)/FAD-dependent oxidoreductase n=1 Tax=Telmatospirillum sp. J64-1 TaxID=2502183 RepID=UPI00115E04A2|nr:FAD-dependent oxidoreductase [Telmatospirillum sp. J64-1]